MRSRSVFMMSLAHSWVPNKMPVRRRRLEPRNRAGPHTVGVRSVTWRNRCRECTGSRLGVWRCCGTRVALGVHLPVDARDAPGASDRADRDEVRGEAVAGRGFTARTPPKRSAPAPAAEQTAAHLADSRETARTRRATAN